MMNLYEIETLLTTLFAAAGITLPALAVTIGAYLLYRFERNMFWKVIYTIERVITWPFRMLWKGVKTLFKKVFRLNRSRY